MKVLESLRKFCNDPIRAYTTVQKDNILSGITNLFSLTEETEILFSRANRNSFTAKISQTHGRQSNELWDEISSVDTIADSNEAIESQWFDIFGILGQHYINLTE